MELFSACEWANSPTQLAIFVRALRRNDGQVEQGLDVPQMSGAELRQEHDLQELQGSTTGTGERAEAGQVPVEGEDTGICIASWESIDTGEGAAAGGTAEDGGVGGEAPAGTTRRIRPGTLEASPQTRQSGPAGGAGGNGGAEQAAFATTETSQAISQQESSSAEMVETITDSTQGSAGVAASICGAPVEESGSGSDRNPRGPRHSAGGSIGECANPAGNQPESGDCTESERGGDHHHGQLLGGEAKQAVVHYDIGLDTDDDEELLIGDGTKTPSTYGDYRWGSPSTPIKAWKQAALHESPGCGDATGIGSCGNGSGGGPGPGVGSGRAEQTDASVKDILARAFDILLGDGGAAAQDVISVLSQIDDLPVSHEKHGTFLKLKEELGKVKLNEAVSPSPKSKSNRRNRK